MSNPAASSPNASSSVWERIKSSLPTLTRSEQATVYNQMRHNARANVDFYVMILLSSTIAFFGLLQDSGAVIIGAMLVAPLMSPMIAIAHSIVMGNVRMFSRAAMSTLSGMVGAIAVAALMTVLLPYIDMMPPSNEVLARTHPNIVDQYIALASGAAAAYALSRKGVAAALPGVAIAAALVPPLCVVGYGLGSVRWEIATGALLLFLTNLAAIVFASAVVFMLLGFRPTRREFTENVRRGAVLAVIGLLVVTVPLLIATLASIQQQKTQVIVEDVLADVVPADHADVEDISITPTDGGYLIGLTVYRSSDETARTEAKLEQQLGEALYNRLNGDSDDAFVVRVRLIDSDLAQFTAARSEPSAP